MYYAIVEGEETKFIEQIKNKFPNGSGFDYDWHLEDKGKYVKATSSFTCYTEHGYRHGAADFSLIIFKKPETFNPKTEAEWSCISFNLHFHGSISQWLNRKYMLRDYIEDTIHYCLNEKEGDI